MSILQAYLLGIMTVMTPSMLVLAWLLYHDEWWQVEDGERRRQD